MDVTDTRNSPVFILGLPRSGTTLLYQMLEASGCFNILTARHVIFFDELRRGWVDRARSRQRLYDQSDKSLGAQPRALGVRT